VIVSKRDPESAHPVRVASMDYFVPEKVPQPKNVLESLVWDREKEVDRARERFQVRCCEMQLALVRFIAGRRCSVCQVVMAVLSLLSDMVTWLMTRHDTT
jgi:hypothetical protein